MSEDVLAFLDGPVEPPKTDTAVTEPVKTSATPASTETPVTPAKEEPKATDTAPVQDDKSVPLATFLDMRDKLKTTEKRLKELEPTEEIVVPDPVKQPREYADFRAAQTEITMLNDRLNFSERLARKEHGAELIDKVRDWALSKFEQDEVFTRRILGNSDPYEAAIKEFNKEQLLSELSDEKEIEAFRAWKASQANGGSPPPAQSSTGTKPPAPQPPAAKPAPVIPKSLVDAPSGGSRGVDTSVGEGAAFDSIFNK